MRWFADVLARLAIAASCTSSAAAFDAQVLGAQVLGAQVLDAQVLGAQVDRSKSLSSADSSWEQLMPNSSQSANGVTRLYGVAGRGLRVGSRDGRDIVHDGVTRPPRLDEPDVRSCPSVMRPMTQSDHRNAAPWSSPILAF